MRDLVKQVFPLWYEWKEAGVRGIPSPFIKIYERGRDTPIGVNLRTRSSAGLALGFGPGGHR